MGLIYGVTAAGFVAKPLDQCLAELEALAKASFGNGIKLNPSSKWGQFLGLLSDRESELWDMGQELAANRDPDQATGAGLDGICAITGVGRNAAAKSRVVATIGGVAGTVIPIGKVASVTGTGTRFALIAEVTIGGGGTVSGTFDAEQTGALPAPAGTLTTLETPVAGWNTVTNPADAVLGRDLETDSLLRQRRENTLAIAGSATDSAVMAEVTRVAGVTTAAVYLNDEDVVSPEGMTPHSIEVIVSGGTDAAVAEAIWKSKSAGIKSEGTTAVVVVDASGNNQTVRFSRPAGLPAYLALTISKDTRYSMADPPLDGDSLVKAAIAAWGAANIIAGETLYPRSLLGAIFGVQGVYNVPSVNAGLAPAPATEAPVVATRRQIVQLDAARITIVYG